MKFVSGYQTDGFVEGRREEAILPSIIHRGHHSICFSTFGNADVAGRGLWGFLCLSVWSIVH